MPIKIRKSKDGKFFVRVTGKNGKVLLHCEGLNQKRSAFTNIQAATIEFKEGVIIDETK